MLISSLAEEVLYLAIGHNTSRGVWVATETALGSTSRSRTLSLLTQLQGLQQGDSSTSKYLGRAQIVVELLAQAGRPIGLDEQNLHVFRGLRPEFRSLVASLTTKSQLLTIPEVADLLNTHRYLFPEDAVPTGFPQPAVMVAQQAPSHPRNNHDDGRGRGRNHRGQRGRGQRGRGGIRCQICDIPGHTALTCYRRFEDFGGQRLPPAQSGVHTAPQPQAHVAYQQQQHDLTTAPFSNIWLPDTGANAHVTPNVNGLAGVETYTGGDTLQVGDGSGLDIQNTGSVSLNTQSRSLFLKHVLHVPKLRASLLSVQKFTRDNDVYFEFHPDYFLVKDRTTQQTLLRGPSTGGMYTLTLPKPVAYLSAKASPKIWHELLGHPHSRVLR
ncbi:PREDICTED: uncharacterized protein LOC109149916 [Ipomoea nil]|uniref:uncharacterized protein LOC109149916 n=1 Tax=Ipomoea nil TaxID=35883 RepID=UPI000900970B|nr:PREDICTED: uncharacterized protein LOC109149916 [Ipomoea nil]